MHSLFLVSPNMYFENPNISNNGADRERKAKVPLYLRKTKNLESFCTMFLSFKNLCKHWSLTGNTNAIGALEFALFEQHLGGNALHEWQIISNNAPSNSVAQFKNSVDTFITRMSAGKSPRNNASSFLKSPAVRKTMKTDVSEHIRRLELLCFYHDMLPGTSQKLDETDNISVLAKKTIIYKSFPKQWQDLLCQQKGPIEDPSITVAIMEEYFQATTIRMDNTLAAKERPYPKYQNQGQQNGGNRYPPRPTNNYQGRPSGNNQNQRRFGNQAPNNRAPNNRPPGNSQGRGFQNHHYAESHFNQEAGCFVPDGTVPVEDQGGMPQGGMPQGGMPQGGMPSAVEQHAEDQPEQNDQYFVQGQFVQLYEQNENASSS
ncbi:unnamed protein product [Cylindrotheca closterium]|uniref:Uncharacterized protein n=1 Tax=Cylindrotheca closterium TaxID=2856 RepID=A0AAD2FVK0_9STRA|nr:unnamed protein product [Cylindrotheca closterium]